MYQATFSPRFLRDVKACKKKHWNEKALKCALEDLINSDTRPLKAKYKDHALAGPFMGYRSIHVDSSPNPPSGVWVLMYEIMNKEIVFVRTGTHAEVYEKQN